MTAMTLPTTLTANQVTTIMERPEIALELRRKIEEVKLEHGRELIDAASEAAGRYGWCGEARAVIEELSFVDLPYFTAKVPVTITITKLRPHELTEYNMDSQSHILDEILGELDIENRELFDETRWNGFEYTASVNDGEAEVTYHG
jgi:hypothetical protein